MSTESTTDPPTGRDDFAADDVITIDGQPGLTVGQLAAIAFANDPPGPASLGTLFTGLGAAFAELFDLRSMCASSGCDNPASYIGVFVPPAAGKAPMPSVRYCETCASYLHAAGMFTGVTNLLGRPCRPPEPGSEGRHNTAIGWTHWPGTVGATIVSVTGCDPASPGCDNCYAALASSMPRLTRLDKYQGVAVDGKFTGVVKMHPHVLDAAVRKQRSHTWFHNSMSDTFHPKVPDGHIAYHFAIAAATPWHNWINLTKRHARMAALLTSARFVDLVVANFERTFPALTFPGWPLPNMAVGVSVEDQQHADMRMPHLERVADHVACVAVSAEPLLGPVDLTRWLDGPAHNKLWVIGGGESGPNHRPVNLDDLRSLRDQCHLAGVPYYLKQIGGRLPTSGGRMLDGEEHNEWPAMAYREAT